MLDGTDDTQDRVPYSQKMCNSISRFVTVLQWMTNWVCPVFHCIPCALHSACPGKSKGVDLSIRVSFQCSPMEAQPVLKANLKSTVACSSG